MHDAIERLNSALSGRYLIERELGAGGMSTVYLARDERHGRHVALKVLDPAVGAAVGADRFLAEIETTANMHHPHILPLFDSGEADGLLYYVMPRVEGESLRERLDRDGRLDVEQALSIVQDVCAALAHAHARGVVHRDIKPSNILMEDGEALVSDFGIARAISSGERAQLTSTGVPLGTPAYMAPEQIEGSPDVDERADVYAVGCLLYELLTASRPFRGSTVHAMFSRALTDPPPSARAARSDVPRAIDAAIVRAMSKNPDHRFQSIQEFQSACLPSRGSLPGDRSPGGRSQFVPMGVSVVSLALVIVVGALAWRASRSSSARASLTEITRLADEGRYREAYDLAVGAERWIGGDSVLDVLFTEVADDLTITSDPAGAQVFVQPFPGDSIAIAHDSTLLGTTPIIDRRVPRVDHRVVVSMMGYVPVERIASSALVRNEVARTGGGATDLAVRLHPVGAVPPDMVAVPGGDYEMVGPDAPTGLSTRLGDFFIDRHEVSNEAFATFIEAGGYAEPEHWVDATGVPRSDFVDRTGLPAPRTWSRQEFGEGAARLPVTGVSWYEAAAYCRFMGKRLPTVYEWEKTARNGEISHTGVLMPWGYVGSGDRAGAMRANFNSDRPTPVDAFPFGVSPYGAYGMAGNVQEWTANSFGDGYAVTGGAWDGPAYLYTEHASRPAETASPALGFRCAMSEGSSDQGAGAIDLRLEAPTYTPVDERGFQALLEHYRYDRRTANPRVTDTTRTSVWTRERMWIDGIATDSVLLYLYTPTNAAPPYQTIVYVPSSGVFCCETLPEGMEWAIGPTIQAGRAVLAVVLEGMRERASGLEARPAEPSSVRFRDIMVRQATELRLGIDYIETRDDIDSDRLAYAAVSWGAGSRLVFSAIDDRFSAVAFIGGGIDERVKPTLPEADNVNFAPHISAPTLMINGRSDEEHPWLTRGIALWNLLREPKELVLIDGAGHVVPLEIRIPAINDFFDRTLGPVR
jgi:formylglycine-generating enzyme required for sulfatase activity/pimeloyl-ACP methyl ester carboxylesterase